MSPDDLDHLMELIRLLAREVAVVQTGMEQAFEDERGAERELLLEILDAARPAFPVLATRSEAIMGLQGARAALHQVVIDRYVNEREEWEWIAADHHEVGLVIAKKAVGMPARLVWPSGTLPSGREGGPRLVPVLESLADRLLVHTTGNGPRRRREAAQMREKLEAIRTLLR